MKKILLMIEDYKELVYLETLLKKVSWDVQGSQHELGFSDQLLGFSPDILIMTAFGKKINGEKVGPKLQGLKKKPKLLLIGNGHQQINESDYQKHNVEKFFSSPINVQELFKCLETIGDFDAVKAIKKLDSQKKYRESEEAVWVATDKKQTGNNNNKSSKKSTQPINGVAKSEIALAAEKVKKLRFADRSKMQTYSKYLEEIADEELEHDGLDRSFVEEQEKEFKQYSDDPEILRIDEERKIFVVAMYNKKSS